MRLFLDWITSINLSAASCNASSLYLFFFKFFSPSLPIAFVVPFFIDANPAHLDDALVSVTHRYCACPPFRCLFFGHRRIWMEKQRVVIWSSGFLLFYQLRRFSPFFFFHSSLTVMLISVQKTDRDGGRKGPFWAALTRMTHHGWPYDLYHHRDFLRLPRSSDPLAKNNFFKCFDRKERK